MEKLFKSVADPEENWETVTDEYGMVHKERWNDMPLGDLFDKGRMLGNVHRFEQMIGETPRPKKNSENIVPLFEEKDENVELRHDEGIERMKRQLNTKRSHVGGERQMEQMSEIGRAHV